MSAAQSTHQTVSFTSETSEFDVGMGSAYDSTRDVAHNEDASLASFFARPIITPLSPWVVGSATPYNVLLNPWVTFFTNPRVVNRMANFSLLSCTLKVKIMINGGPFYFGRIMVDYNPFVANDYISQDAAGGQSALVTASQRLHLFVDPTTSMGGTLTLPFVYPKDKTTIITSELLELGVLYIREINQLGSVSSSTDSIEMSYAVWAEDVKLSAPSSDTTPYLVPQADEYGTTPVSSIASAVSQAAGKLWSVPVIGPYMRATSMISSAIGTLAKAFGYSRPIIVDAIQPMRPNFVGNLVNCDAPDSSIKLSVDSKQELSIDPRTFGVDTGDELVLSRLASVQSYLVSIPWTTLNAPGDHLYNFRVTPCQARLNSSIYYPTASCFVAQPFRFWKGTVRFRFQIVASAFHRGRIKIVYDPSFCKSVESNVAFTRIVDLADERDFTIDVAWANPRSWLLTDNLSSTSSNKNLLSFNAARRDNTNGVLAIYVLNGLTSSAATNANIFINAFVSMTDDAEFAVPTELNTNGFATPYSLVPQSEPYGEGTMQNTPEVAPTSICFNNCLEPNESDLVYMGEKITSFRQLLKRYTFFRSDIQTASGPYTWTSVRTDFPPYPGYLLSGQDFTTTSAPYNYAKPHLLHYLTPAFACVKGSIRSKYVVNSPTIQDVLSLTVTKALDSGNPSTIFTANPTTSTSVYARERFLSMPDHSSGAVTTVPSRQPYIEIEHPYQQYVRFAYGRNVSCSNVIPSSTTFGTHGVTVVAGTTTNPVRVDRYVACGEDYSLVWFCGAPPQSVKTTPAARVT